MRKIVALRNEKGSYNRVGVDTLHGILGIVTEGVELIQAINKTIATKEVSTHSRPKAAGANDMVKSKKENVSTHSRPKAAGFRQH